MYPYLFSIGTFDFPANLAFFGLGLAAGFLVSLKEARRLGATVGYSLMNVVLFFLGAVPFAILFGKFNSWLYNIDFLFIGSGFDDLIHSGFVSFGAMLAALLYGCLYAHLRKLSIGEELDLISLVLPLIESIYRIGCLLSGCCYGKVTSGFGGVYLPNTAGEWAYRYPTQILIMVFTFCLFVWLWQRRKRKPYSGSQTIQFLSIYSIGRFLIDFLREGLPGFAGLYYQQITALVILFFTFLSSIWLRKLAR